jgi:hypothetical protein
MNCWKSSPFRFVMGCVASMAILGMAFIYASEKPKGGEKHDLRRIAKIKGSTGTVDQNMEAQMIFQPGKQSEMKISVKSGNKTYSLEMTVSSTVDIEEPWHSIEAKFVEQIGTGKPVIQYQPRLRTIEGVPAAVEIRTASGEGFSFEILIEPIK